MLVNKTVFFNENGNFYEAESQHAGSLNIHTETPKRVFRLEQEIRPVDEQSLPSTPTFLVIQSCYGNRDGEEP